MISNIKNWHFIKLFIFSLFLLIGFFIYEDFGFNIDEKFHRSNGFYWLSYIANFFNLEQLALLSDYKLNEIQGFALSDINHFNKYGIVFDVPAALIEILLKLNQPYEYYYLRHALVFLYFYFGLFFLYKILLNRFKKDYLAILGIILMFITPRIFGDSFQNIKDIIFLVLVIISSFFCFKTIDKPTIKNIILFAIFAAAASSIRLFGISLIVTYIVLQLTLISKINFLIIIKRNLILLLSFVISIIIIWPLLWENPISNFLSYFKILDDYFNAKVFFLGKYYDPNLLPYYYLPIWILISTPILHLLLFFFGFFSISKRFIKRYINISNKKSYPDFWRGKNEFKDTFILVNFLLILVGLMFLNIKLYNSWRLAYFLYFFIIYFCIFSVFLFSFKKNFYKVQKIIVKILFYFLFLFTVLRLISYHPYQSLYFNILVPNNIKNSVEVDYTGLSSIEFLKETLSTNSNKEVIKIGVVSWYPIWQMLELINDKDVKKIKIVEIKENNKSHFLYSNRISDVDKNYNKKYDIPYGFTKLKEKVIDGAIIYEVYEREK